MGCSSFKRSAGLLLYFSKGATFDRGRTEQKTCYWNCEISLQRPAQSLRGSTANASVAVGSGNWTAGDTQLRGGAAQPLHARDGRQERRIPLCNH